MEERKERQQQRKKAMSKRIVFFANLWVLFVDVGLLDCWTVGLS